MKINRDLIGKVITVRIPSRDHTGKKTLNKNTKITGTCTYAGYNEILGMQQVTIGRMPIYPIYETDITLVK
jgi:hypothetical protein